MPATAIVQKGLWSSNSNGEPLGGNAFVFELASTTSSGNMLRLRLYYPSGATVSSITDDAGNTWPTTPDVSVTDTSNLVTLGVFHVFNATAGATKITVTFAAVEFGVCAGFQEWCGIGTSSPVDGTPASTFNAGASAKGGQQQVNAGTSYTPTANGDLIFHECMDSGNGPEGFSGGLALDQIQSIIPDPMFTFADTDIIQGYFSAYQLQPVAMAVNPTALVTDLVSNGGWCVIVYGIKTDTTKGTMPTTLPRCVGVYHARYAVPTGLATRTYPLQWPTLGTTQMFGISDPFGSTNLVGVASAANVVNPNWVTRSAATGDAQFAYNVHSVPSPNEMLTLSINDSAAHGYFQGVLYDWVGLGNLDTIQATIGSSTFGPGNTSPVAPITPGVSAGAVICVMGIATGPPISLVTPSGGRYMSTNYTNETDASTVDNGDGHAYNVYSSNATQNWVLDNSASSTGFDCVNASFTLGPAVTTQPATQVLVAPGGSVTLTVAGSISSGGGSLSYQWQKNGSNISGATSASYTFTPNWPSDTNSIWQCVVTDSNGSTYSNYAHIGWQLEASLTYVQPQQPAPIPPQFGNLQLNAYEYREFDYATQLNVKFWF